MFKLIRTYPTHIEINITPLQLVSMFPIELQEHPTMGEVERIWKTKDRILSVNTLSDCVIKLSNTRTHIKVCDDKMFSLLEDLDEFEIVLYYEGKEDKYLVKKL